VATDTHPTIAASAKTKNTRGSLLRVLGVGFGLAVIIGNTIGSGILRTPGEIAQWLPNAWLFLGIWVIGGLYALLGAFSVSELSAMIPRSGGYYIYARRAFGDFPAFVVGWTDFLAQTGTTAAVAIVIGEYTGDLIPALAGHTVMIACTVAVLMAVLQWHSIIWGSFVQNLTSAAKALGFVLLVAAIFFFRSSRPAAEAHHALAGGNALFLAVVLALQAVIYTYDGWYAVMYFGEEVKDPGKDIPKSMIGGVLSVMAIYLLVNAAILYVLPMSKIAGQDLAIGTVAKSLFGQMGDTLLRVLTVVSMLSGINAYHLMASRIPFAMSRDRMLPKQLSNANPGGTPTVGLLAAVVVSVLLIVFAKVFERASAIMAFFFVADYAMAYLGVFVLRKREPETPRPYRAWGFPYTTGIALIGSITFLIAAIMQDTANSVWALAMLGLSYPLFLVAKRSLRAQTA
jgi:APA family basic amino acid/polyamine antiporter